ncbi:hypothetical protein Ancab_021329 [Ancistrocladus abbreviatus]
MGRGKLKMEFKGKEKERNNTLQKRKKGLKKKAYELSTLCDVPVCLIIYPYNDDNNNPVAGTQSSEPDIWPENPEKVREIINRYNSIPKEDRQKRAVSIFDILEGRKRKAEQDLLKLRKKSMAMKYLSWHVSFDSLDKDQLMKMLLVLDEKLESVKRRIAMLKQGSQGLVAPVSCYPSSSLQSFGFLKSEFDEGFINCFPTCPVDMGAQLVPFGCNPLPAPTVPIAGNIFDPTQMGMKHSSGSSSSAAAWSYIVDPVGYDQVLRVVNDIPAVSSYVPSVMWCHGDDDLQYSMPVQMPMLMSNVGHGGSQMNGGSEYINEFEMFHE